MRACCAIVGNDEILNLLLLNHDSESSIVEPSRSYSCHPSIYTSLRISFRFGISSEDKFATCSRRVLTRFEGLDSTSTSTPSSLVPGSNQAVAVTGGSGRKKRSAGAINSWVLFRDARLKSRPARIGETREQRRKRVIEEASIDFKKPEFRDEKKMLSLVAKERNAVVRLGKKHPAIAAKSESQSHRKNPVMLTWWLPACLLNPASPNCSDKARVLSPRRVQLFQQRQQVQGHWLHGRSSTGLGEFPAPHGQSLLDWWNLPLLAKGVRGQSKVSLRNGEITLGNL